MEAGYNNSRNKMIEPSDISPEEDTTSSVKKNTDETPHNSVLMKKSTSGPSPKPIQPKLPGGATSSAESEQSKEQQPRFQEEKRPTITIPEPSHRLSEASYKSEDSIPVFNARKATPLSPQSTSVVPYAQLDD